MENSFKFRKSFWFHLSSQCCHYNIIIIFYVMMQTKTILQWQQMPPWSRALCVKLPVGRGTGVEDVLFGRKQRQAVGIKVDRPRVHDGKSFQTTQLLSSLVPTCFAVGVSAGKTATAEHRGSFRAEKTAVEVCGFMQCGFKFQIGAICAGAAHSQRGGDCDCTLVFVQQGRLSFHQNKAPPPVERVESIMTSLAGSLGRNATAEQHVQLITASCFLLNLILTY